MEKCAGMYQENTYTWPMGLYNLRQKHIQIGNLKEHTVTSLLSIHVPHFPSIPPSHIFKFLKNFSSIPLFIYNETIIDCFSQFLYTK